MAIQIGDKMPDKLGVNQLGEPVLATMLRGKKVALYFLS